MTIHHLRRTYQAGELLEENASADPFDQFRLWFEEAKNLEAPSWFEVNAMTLSTCAVDGPLRGQVSSRIVLLKMLDPENRFVFFTNYESGKGQQLANNPHASLCFYWAPQERQIRIQGTVEQTSRELSIEYFHSRPRGSQFGALVSQQSSVVSGREVLEQRLAQLQQTYGEQELPCPDNWGGYALTPTELEFWQGRDNRLHDRLRYRLQGKQWVCERLAP